jgi:hypothetical protein
MQIIKSFVNLFIFILPMTAFSQSTYLSQGDKAYQLLERLEIKRQNQTQLLFSATKPYNRADVVHQVEQISREHAISNDSFQLVKSNASNVSSISTIDKYNIDHLLMNNVEWVNGNTDFKSKKPLLKYFYGTKSNMIEVNNKDFFLSVNPMIQFNLGKSSDNTNRMFLNSRGLVVRGLIAKKIGFYTSLLDNQERGPAYLNQYVSKYSAVPGVGFYKGFKVGGLDYFDARGYLTFSATKFVNVQFGYDKNFIGNGYRSLFLSDWGNSYLFLKLNTKIWKFNYQNIFMELMPQYRKYGDSVLSRKYAAMHHLSLNVTRWLNIGFFEGVIFGRKDHFDFQYLNPIIFYRHIEGTIGSPDNALAGADFKANIAKRFQIYGQLLLDEFKLDQVRENTGWWANKWGLQLGAKYVDAFGIKNLDLQFESNRVRPFTYSHNNVVSNYTHYNQPLAHPLGANFQEFVGIIRYQPAPRWYVNVRTLFYVQGLDSLNGRNYGANPFNLYTINRVGEYGYNIGSGRKATCLNALFQLSYELRENLYLDLSAQYRKYTIQNEVADPSSNFVNAGIRFNMFRREYDY